LSPSSSLPGLAWPFFSSEGLASRRRPRWSESGGEALDLRRRSASTPGDGERGGDGDGDARRLRRRGETSSRWLWRWRGGEAEAEAAIARPRVSAGSSVVCEIEKESGGGDRRSRPLRSKPAARSTPARTLRWRPRGGAGGGKQEDEVAAVQGAFACERGEAGPVELGFGVLARWPGLLRKLSRPHRISSCH
jgi:hypothetical protein